METDKNGNVQETTSRYGVCRNISKTLHEEQRQWNPNLQGLQGRSQKELCISSQ